MVIENIHKYHKLKFEDVRMYLEQVLKVFLVFNLKS